MPPTVIKILQETHFYRVLLMVEALQVRPIRKYHFNSLNYLPLSYFSYSNELGT